MSSPATPTTTWESILANVTTFVNAAAPFVNGAITAVELVDPAIAPAISLGSKILAGVADAEPTAVALFNSITSGTPPTAAQLQAYATAYETAYQQLNADINAALAALPPAAT